MMKRPKKPKQPKPPQQAILLRKVEAAQRLGCSVWSIDRWIREGLFPKPIYLMPGSPARWLARDIDAWVDKRKLTRRPRPEVRGVVKQFADLANG